MSRFVYQHIRNQVAQASSLLDITHLHIPARPAKPIVVFKQPVPPPAPPEIAEHAEVPMVKRTVGLCTDRIITHCQETQTEEVVGPYDQHTEPLDETMDINQNKPETTHEVEIKDNESVACFTEHEPSLLLPKPEMPMQKSMNPSIRSGISDFEIIYRRRHAMDRWLPLGDN